MSDPKEPAGFSDTPADRPRPGTTRPPYEPTAFSPADSEPTSPDLINQLPVEADEPPRAAGADEQLLDLHMPDAPDPGRPRWDPAADPMPIELVPAEHVAAEPAQAGAGRVDAPAPGDAFVEAFPAPPLTTDRAADFVPDEGWPAASPVEVVRVEAPDGVAVAEDTPEPERAPVEFVTDDLTTGNAGGNAGLTTPDQDEFSPGPFAPEPTATGAVTDKAIWGDLAPADPVRTPRDEPIPDEAIAAAVAMDEAAASQPAGAATEVVVVEPVTDAAPAPLAVSDSTPADVAAPDEVARDVAPAAETVQPHAAADESAAIEPPPPVAPVEAATEPALARPAEASPESAPEPTPDPARREFMKRSLAVLAGTTVVLVPAAAGVLTFLDPLGRRGGAAAFIPVTTLDALKDEGVPYRFQVVTDKVDAWTTSRNVPVGAVYLIRRGQQVTAFNVVCPHAGCFVDVKPGVGFSCPCHRSFFGLDGVKTPDSVSPRDLDRLEVDPEALARGSVAVKFQNFLAGTPNKLPV